MYGSVSSITPFTLLDFPGRTACILWFSGCNLRCPYCHNPELVRGVAPRMAPREAERFLESRERLLEGVVLSGGECTLCPDIVELCRDLKRRGFLVKIDTNGCRPDVVKNLIEGGLVDCFALDYKAPRDKFAQTTGRDQFDLYSRSLDAVIASGIECEARTTTHSGLLGEADVNAIIYDLERRGYRGKYYVQNFFQSYPAKPTLSELPEHEPLDRRLIRSSERVQTRFRNFETASF